MEWARAALPEKERAFAIFFAIIMTTSVISMGALAGPGFLTDRGSHDTVKADNPPAPDIDIWKTDEVEEDGTIRIAVTGENNGGTAGEWSTISISAPDYDRSGDASQVRIQSTNAPYEHIADVGDTIVDRHDEPITADHVLVEAGTGNDGTWYAGQSYQLTAAFEPKGPGEYEFFVRVTLTDPDDTTRRYTAPNPGDTTDQQGFAVYRVDVTVTEERVVDAAVTEVSIVDDEYTTGDHVTADATIKNVGTHEETFFVGYSVEGRDGELRDNDGTTGSLATIPSGEEMTVTLSWEVEDDAPLGSYDAHVAVWRDTDPENLVDDADRHVEPDAFDVVEPEVSADIIEVELPSGEYTEGDSVETTAVVQNTGDERESFFVGYSVFDPEGTEYHNDRQTGEPVTLDPDETVTIDLVWHVEDDIPTGEYAVQVTAWAETDRYDLRNPLDTEIYGGVFTVTEPTIEAAIEDWTPASGTYDRGDAVRTEVDVVNTGDTEHTFFVGYSMVDDEGHEYHNDHETGTPITLDPEESASLDLEWIVESDAPEATYDIHVTIWEESDRNDLRNPLDTRIDRDAVEVVVEHLSEAEIADWAPASGTYHHGDSVETTVEVVNDGDREHTYFVGYSVFDDDGNEYHNDRQTGEPVTLEPGEAAEIDLEWIVESDARPGAYDVHVVVWHEDDRYNLHNEVARSEAESQFVVAVDEPITVELTQSLRPFYDAEDAEIDVVIENPSHQTHDVRIAPTIVDDTELSAGNEESYRLEAGESRVVTLSWDDVPDHLMGQEAWIGVSIEEESSVVLGRTAFVSEYTDVTVTVNDWETAERLSDVEITGEIVGQSMWSIAGVQHQPVETAPGEFTFEDVPDTALLRVSVEKDGYLSEQRMLDPGGEMPLYSNPNIVLREYVDQRLLIKDADTGEPLRETNLEIRETGEELATDATGYVDMWQVPKGAEWTLATDQYEDRELTFEVDVDHVREVAVYNNPTVGGLEAQIVVEEFENFDDSKAEAERIEESLDELLEQGRSGSYQLFVRVNGEMRIVIVNLDLWEVERSDDAYVVITEDLLDSMPEDSSEFDVLYTASHGENVPFKDPFEMGVEEGVQSGMHPDHAEFHAESVGVFQVDRDSYSYRLGYFVGFALTEHYGKAQRGVRDRNIPYMAYGGGFIALDLATIGLASTGVRLVKGGAVAGGKVLRAPLALAKERSGALLGRILAQSGNTQLVKHQLRGADRQTLRHTLSYANVPRSQKYDIILDYYRHQGSGANPARTLVDDASTGLTRADVVRIAESGGDLRATRTLVDNGVGATAIRGYADHGVDPRHLRQLADDDYLRVSEIDDMGRAIHSRNAPFTDPRTGHQVDAARMFENAAELRGVEGFSLDKVVSGIRVGNVGNVKGEAVEFREAVRIGPRNIERMNWEPTNAEFDIVTRDGRLIEVKPQPNSVEIDQVRRYVEYARSNPEVSNVVEVRVHQVEMTGHGTTNQYNQVARLLQEEFGNNVVLRGTVSVEKIGVRQFSIQDQGVPHEHRLAA